MAFPGALIGLIHQEPMTCLVIADSKPHLGSQVIRPFINKTKSRREFGMCC